MQRDCVKCVARNTSHAYSCLFVSWQCLFECRERERFLCIPTFPRAVRRYDFVTYMHNNVLFSQNGFYATAVATLSRSSLLPWRFSPCKRPRFFQFDGTVWEEVFRWWLSCCSSSCLRRSFFTHQCVPWSMDSREMRLKSRYSMDDGLFSERTRGEHSDGRPCRLADTTLPHDISFAGRFSHRVSELILTGCCVHPARRVSSTFPDSLRSRRLDARPASWWILAGIGMGYLYKTLCSHCCVLGPFPRALEISETFLSCKQLVRARHAVVRTVVPMCAGRSFTFLGSVLRHWDRPVFFQILQCVTQDTAEDGILNLVVLLSRHCQEGILNTTGSPQLTCHDWDEMGWLRSSRPLGQHGSY